MVKGGRNKIEKFNAKHRSSSFAFLFGLWLCSSCPSYSEASSEMKKIFFLSGPHHTGSNSIHQFLFDRARPLKNGEKHPSFANWTWPNLDGSSLVTKALEEAQLPPRNVFDFLVTKINESELHRQILKGIQTAFKENDTVNVVVGTAMFESIGDAPYSDYHGLDVMKEVIHQLDADNEQVTVVLNYRVPRVDHWLSSFRTHSQSSGDIDETVDDSETLEEEKNDYKSFVCAKKDSPGYNKVLELLRTSLNPLRLADAFHEQGWDVMLIDMKGVKRDSRELPHVVACDAMKVPCNSKGKVLDLWNVKPHLNKNEQDDTIEDLLSNGKKEDLDRWFWYRDCLFKYLDQVNGFTVLLRDSVFAQCDPSKIDFYRAVSGNVTELYNRIRFQMDCHDFTPTDEATLMVTPPQQPHPWQVEDTAGDKKEPPSKAKPDKPTQVMTTTKHENTKAKTKGNRKKEKSPGLGMLEIPIFLLITVMAGTMQMARLRSTLRDPPRSTDPARSEYSDEPSSFEREMVDMQAPRRSRRHRQIRNDQDLADEYGEQEEIL
jgi:hypothetical protein